MCGVLGDVTDGAGVDVVVEVVELAIAVPDESARAATAVSSPRPLRAAAPTTWVTRRTRRSPPSRHACLETACLKTACLDEYGSGADAMTRVSDPPM